MCVCASIWPKINQAIYSGACFDPAALAHGAICRWVKFCPSEDMEQTLPEKS